jgi:hypothetical protein
VVIQNIFDQKEILEKNNLKLTAQLNDAEGTTNMK